MEADIETGPSTHALVLQVRRLPSRAFESRIDGTAWVDDVSLVPVAGSSLSAASSDNTGEESR